MMKIILIEFEDEARRLIEELGDKFLKSDDVKVICLHPKVRSFLKQKGIPSSDTIIYLDNAAHTRIIAGTEELTQQIVNQIHLEDRRGLDQGYSHSSFYHIRMYINHCFWIVEIIDAIRQKEKVHEFIACVVPRENMFEEAAPIQDHERLMGHLLCEYARRHHINIRTFSMEVNEPDLKEAILGTIVRQCSKLISRMEYRYISGKMRAEDKPIVVPGLSYRMDILLKEIRQRHEGVKVFVVWTSEGSLKKELYKLYLTLKNIWNKLCKRSFVEMFVHVDLLVNLAPASSAIDEKWRRDMYRLQEKVTDDGTEMEVNVYGVNIFPYIFEKISESLVPAQIKLEHLTAVLEKIYDDIRPVLIMSMYSIDLYYMMGELANFKGIAALNISHGTHVPPHNENERIENYRLSMSVISNSFPFVAVQTPWTDKFLDYYQDTRTRLKTGPLLYSVCDKKSAHEIREKYLGENKEAKIVLHAATQKVRQALRFHMTESLDEYIASLEDIVNAVNAQDDVYLFVRPHPVCNLSEQDFRTLLPDCPRMRIINEGPFASLLSASDLLISYSSTVIEEALQNDIPVFLYDKWKRYCHFDIPETVKFEKEINKQPVYYVTEPESLIQGMGIILKMPTPMLFNEEEKIKYCYPKDAKNEFYSFVEKVLKGEMKSECSVDYGQERQFRTS